MTVKIPLFTKGTILTNENAFDSDFGRSMPFHHSVDQLYKSVNSKKWTGVSREEVVKQVKKWSNLSKEELRKLQKTGDAPSPEYLARWLVPEMAKNGYESVFAYLSS